MIYAIIAIVAAFVAGVVLASRIIAEVHVAETSVHDRIKALHDKVVSLEEALRAKL